MVYLRLLLASVGSGGTGWIFAQSFLYTSGDPASHGDSGLGAALPALGGRTQVGGVRSHDSRVGAVTRYSALWLAPFFLLIGGMSDGFGVEERSRQGLLHHHYHNEAPLIQETADFSSLSLVNGDLLRGLHPHVVGVSPPLPGVQDFWLRAADNVLGCGWWIGPEYYQFPLVTTGRVPGTGSATGVGEVAFTESPYGVALGDDGSYRYDFTVRFKQLKMPRDGTYVLWTTTPDLEQIALVGKLTDPASFSGQVAWNKFLVVVTLEPSFTPDASEWSGPVVIRGMSRSGMMHTMAGHGPFEEEKCAAYGYG